MINRIDFHLGNGQRKYQYRVSIFLPSDLANILKLDNDKVDALCNKAETPNMVVEQTSLYVYGREVKVPFSTNFSNESSMSFYLDETFNIRHILEIWTFYIDAYRILNDNKFLGTLDTADILDKLKTVGDRIINDAKQFAISKLQEGANYLLDNTGAVGKFLKGFTNTRDFFSNTLPLLTKTVNPQFGEVWITPLTYNMNEICTYKLKNAYPIELGAVSYGNELIGDISQFDAKFYYTHYTIERGVYGTDTKSIITGAAKAIGQDIANKIF